MSIEEASAAGKVPAAYLILHRKTNRVYIGSTLHLSSRISSHLSMLRLGCHPVKALQADYDESPEISFRYWLTIDKAEAEQKEQEMVNEAVESGLLYNKGVADVTRPKLGIAISPQQKAILSRTHKNKVVSVETRRRMGDARRNNPTSEKARAALNAATIARTKKVSIEGVIYDSPTRAASMLGMAINAVRWKIRSEKYPSWFYVVNDE